MRQRSRGIPPESHPRERGLRTTAGSVGLPTLHRFCFHQRCVTFRDPHVGVHQAASPRGADGFLSHLHDAVLAVKFRELGLNLARLNLCRERERRGGSVIATVGQRLRVAQGLSSVPQTGGQRLRANKCTKSKKGPNPPALSRHGAARETLAHVRAAGGGRSRCRVPKQAARTTSRRLIVDGSCVYGAHGWLLPPHWFPTLCSVGPRRGTPGVKKRSRDEATSTRELDERSSACLAV